MLLVLAAHHGWSARFFDVILHTPSRLLCAVPPEEHQSLILGGVWEMTKTVSGSEEAPADLDEHFGKVAEDLCEESGSFGLVRLTTEPAAFHSKLTVS